MMGQWSAMAPVRLRYRAFLSYSHANARQAKWLHGALEGYSIDKDLVGRATPRGKVPASLRPVFRDREEFTAGRALPAETLAAIDASAALIVLCSPEAARSAYVDEEVRLFRGRHPGRPVIPVILAGTPGQPQDECFPPSLRFRLDAMGNPTPYPAEVLAADIRDAADGKSLALAKVVACLLGLRTDEVFRRSTRARRRAVLVRNGVIAALTLLAISATTTTVYAWRWAQESEENRSYTLITATAYVNSAVAQVEQYGVPRFVTLHVLRGADSVITSLAEKPNPSPRLQVLRAWLMLAFARNYEMLGDTASWQARAQGAERLLGILHMERPRDDAISRDLSVAQNRVGDALRARGDLNGAAASYRNASTLIRRLARDNPDVVDFQRDLSITLEKIGDVRAVQGDAKIALDSYTAAFGFAELLAKAAPDDDLLQRDLSVLHNKIGDALAPRGDLIRAVAHYRSAQDIAQRLLAATPADGGRQRDLAIARTNVGSALLEQGSLADGKTAIETAQAIWRQLASADPENRKAQSDLSDGQQQVADILRTEGDLAGASLQAAAARAARVSLTAHDPANAEWQRSLAAADDQEGELLRATGGLRQALERHERAIAIRHKLALTEPGNADTQRGLAAAHANAAAVLVDLGRLSDALEHANAALVIRRRMLEVDAGNHYWRFDMSASHETLGDVRREQRQWPGALASFRAALDVRRQLMEGVPGYSTWLREIVVAEAKVCAVLVEMGDAQAAHAAASSAVAMAERLAMLDPGNANAVWLRNRAQALTCIGDAQRAAANLAAAQASYESAARLLAETARSGGTHLGWRHELAMVSHRLSLVGLQQGRREQAIETARQAVKLLRSAIAGASDHVVFARDLKAAETTLAEIERNTLTRR